MTNHLLNLHPINRNARIRTNNTAIGASGTFLGMFHVRVVITSAVNV